MGAGKFPDIQEQKWPQCQAKRITDGLEATYQTAIACEIQNCVGNNKADDKKQKRQNAVLIRLAVDILTEKGIGQQKAQTCTHNIK